MRELDLNNLSPEEESLLALIQKRMNSFHSGSAIIEIFINENNTIFVNAKTKNDGEWLFVLKILKTNDIELVFITREATFIPVKDSNMIGIIKQPNCVRDLYEAIFNIEPGSFSREKLTIREKNGQKFLFITTIYKKSEFTILLNFDTGQILGLIVNNEIIEINATTFSLDAFERCFVEEANRMADNRNSEREAAEQRLLEIILKAGIIGEQLWES